jgi:acetyl esterase
MPRTAGPLPCIVELHGGAWSQFDRTRGKSVHEALARSGVVVVALDFRQGSEGAYPLSVADVNYGIRWVKEHADELKTRPDLVGLSGNSSGGHLAMLVAMKPGDQRYAAISVNPGDEQLDASVKCVVMLWPVINPLGRYRYAKRLRDQSTRPDWVEPIIKFQDSYWQTEANMSEGNPVLALERGEKLVLPPALWIQSTQDEVHIYHDPDSTVPGNELDRFATLYRKAGGSIEVESFDAPMMFTTAHPTLPESAAALRSIAAFVHKHIKP